MSVFSLRQLLQQPMKFEQDHPLDGNSYKNFLYPQFVCFRYSLTIYNVHLFYHIAALGRIIDDVTK